MGRRRHVTQPLERLGSARLWKEIVLSVGALLGVLCIVLAVASTAFDVRPLVFRSGSMAPAIDTGALAISRTVDAADLRAGDIVSVEDDEGVRVTHRIVTIKQQGSSATLVLKGDDNEVADAEPYVVSSAERVLFDVPRAGYVVSWLSGPFGLIALGIYLAFLASVIFGRRDGSGKPGTHRATAGAAALVLVVGAGAGAGGAEPTWAAWSDTATASSGTFKAHYVLPTDAMSCDNGSPVLLGYYNGVTFGITHKNVLYDYELRIYNGSGTQQGSAIAVPSGSAAVGATISSTISASTLAGLLQLGSPVYVRAYSKLKAASSWRSTTYRQWRVDTGLLGILLLNGVKCGADATTGDVTGPVIGFTAPTNGVSTTTSAFREAVTAFSSAEALARFATPE